MACVCGHAIAAVDTHALLCGSLATQLCRTVLVWLVTTWWWMHGARFINLHVCHTVAPFVARMRLLTGSAWRATVFPRRS